MYIWATVMAVYSIIQYISLIYEMDIYTQALNVQ